MRRHRFTGEPSFYRCHSTRPVTLAGLIHIICTRLQAEEDFQPAKGATGLDQGQTTCWNSWMRWTLISILATAVLTVTRARTATTTMAVGLIPVSARNRPAPTPPRHRPCPAPVRLETPPPGHRASLPPTLEQHHRHLDHMTPP
ncbi:hypothetical protein [Streptomyces antibioticus]|uniref:hypothetical protein n=1 Tax=Streptomyces antibioticus TaxID=1890 RepID=UPI0022592954|nr:hypothetical protein [Streptomyces antibioticus]MCX4743788.1 hypothetical protein [Streptomyces antibioticus]